MQLLNRKLLNRNSLFLLSALFISIAVLTKYTAFQVLILLFIYSLTRFKEIRFRIAFLSIPVLFLFAYDLYSEWLYGHSLLRNAFTYAAEKSAGEFSIITSMIFLGGGLVSSFFYFPFIWKKKTTVLICLLSTLAILLLSIALPSFFFGQFYEGDDNFLYLLQAIIMLISGINVLILALNDYRKNRDSESLLLMLWIIIPLLFTALLNWTVNIRSLLPTAPAYAFLILRKLEFFDRQKFLKTISTFAITLSALISILAAYTDYQTANAAKSAAQIITQENTGKYNRIIFQGHWGFQYYMEKSNCIPFDISNFRLLKGDLIIKPSNNGIVYSSNDWIPRGVLQMESVNWLAVNNYRIGAGFYSSIYGKMPYYFGKIPEEKYYTYEVDRDIFVPRSFFQKDRKY